jgi:hypothetical protein
LFPFKIILHCNPQPHPRPSPRFKNRKGDSSSLLGNYNMITKDNIYLSHF